MARLGGDEFAILQISEGQPHAAERLAQRLVETLGMPYDLDGKRAIVGVSVGIALATQGQTFHPDTLLKDADIALYRAKAEGRGKYCVFRPNMGTEMQERRIIELELREVLIRNQLVIFYQPLFDVRRAAVSGYEALLRWHHPERGMIQPAQFIPIAEELGLINAIGDWVLRQACTEAASWPEHMTLSINLSPIQLHTGDVVGAVTAALDYTGFHPSRLALEITELALLPHDTVILSALRGLRELGVRAVLDDFGTGYSSLSYLRLFPFDKIKIDQSFVRGIVEGSDSLVIVRSIVDMISRLGLQTTVEGVETREAYELLKTVPCSEFQGYFFGRPKPLAGVLRDLRATDGGQVLSVSPERSSA